MLKCMYGVVSSRICRHFKLLIIWWREPDNQPAAGGGTILSLAWKLLRKLICTYNVNSAEFSRHQETDQQAFTTSFHYYYLETKQGLSKENIEKTPTKEGWVCRLPLKKKDDMSLRICGYGKVFN